MSALLCLQNITFSQSDYQLLHGIQFDIARGQVIGLLGTNGAGKSTTLKIAAGLLSPTRGRVIITPNSQTAYVPERPPLIPNWTVRQFLRHVCTLQGLDITIQQQSIERVMTQCQLSEILDKACATLSKGNQQRVALAQALLPQPDILLLDEPTSGLDPQQIHAFRELLLTLKSETAIVLSSHIMQEVTALCDTAIVIHNGHQISTLDIKQLSQALLITFAAPLSNDTFADCPAWQSGDGKQHQFSLNDSTNHDSILTYCLQKKLPIRRVADATDCLENQLLAHIEQEKPHA